MSDKIEILKHGNCKFMFIEGDLWMWDTPRERELQKNVADKAFGNVLVAGYGFGILTNFLIKNPKVKSVTTVEIYKECIDEMKKIEKINGKIIISDFYDLPENIKYDCIIGDIWQDIDSLFLKDYLKFKEKSKKLLNKDGLILAWGQDYFEYLIKNKYSK
jgi:16S rRNA A1518/A1519 N6-dimethyltransferase RsmA/KsgA/DIM1 with predicted DNA glycosylase/AP lyase activity